MGRQLFLKPTVWWSAFSQFLRLLDMTQNSRSLVEEASLGDPNQESVYTSCVRVTWDVVQCEDDEWCWCWTSSISADNCHWKKRERSCVVQMNNPGPDRDGHWNHVWVYDCVAGYICFCPLVCFHSVYINEIFTHFSFLFLCLKRA